VDGVNAQIDSVVANPTDYRPQQLAAVEIEPWTPLNVVAVVQGLLRRFGQFGGSELVRQQELDTYGQAWFDQNRPINNPNAPTTIPGGSAVEGQRAWRSSAPPVRPEIVEGIEARRTQHARLERALGLPPKFGSFAVQITTAKSSTGNVMLLGCPQMGEPSYNEPNVTNEVELECPTLHVGGMTVAGIPLVIIGHNESYGWTLTSGISDNTDVYIETTFDASYSSYWHNDEWLPFEAIPDTVHASNGAEYPFMIYRTVHGPVFAADLANHQAFTYKFAFQDHELDMILGFYDIGRGSTLPDFEAAIATLPMSFNVFYSGTDQTIKYWHSGWYQDRTDGVDPRLPHNGDGSEEWGGIRPFGSLPTADNPTQGYFVNWNNKPATWWDNGDNVPWTSSWHPVLTIDAYVSPITPFAFGDLTETPHSISSHGTYQQAFELGATEIIDENICPPGQSAFVGLDGQPSDHVTDQWPLHLAWDMKNQHFGETPLGIDGENDPGAGPFLVHRNSPNPFGRSTRIRFTLPAGGRVSIDVFDSAGRLVRGLFDDEADTGPHGIVWDGRNNSGNAVAAGTYYYRLATGRRILTGKMIIL